MDEFEARQHELADIFPEIRRITWKKEGSRPTGSNLVHESINPDAFLLPTSIAAAIAGEELLKDIKKYAKKTFPCFSFNRQTFAASPASHMDQDDEEQGSSPAGALHYRALQQRADVLMKINVNAISGRLNVVSTYYFVLWFAIGDNWGTGASQQQGSLIVKIIKFFGLALLYTGPEILKFCMAPFNIDLRPRIRAVPLPPGDPPSPLLRVQRELLRQQERRLPRPTVAHRNMTRVLPAQEVLPTHADVDWSAMSLFSVHVTPPDWAAAPLQPADNGDEDAHAVRETPRNVYCVECEDQLLFKVARPDAWDWEAVLERITERAADEDEDDQPAEFYVLYKAKTTKIPLDAAGEADEAEVHLVHPAGVDAWHTEQAVGVYGGAMSAHAAAIILVALLILLTGVTVWTDLPRAFPRRQLPVVLVGVSSLPLLPSVRRSTAARAAVILACIYVAANVW